MSLTVLVIDDERPALDELAFLLGRDHRVARVLTADSATEALRLLQEEPVDAVFTDIAMPGLTGLDLARVLSRFRVPPPVVFVTAHDEHAIRAFDVHALDYVLKPFGRPRFGAAVARALEGLRAMDALTLQRTLASMVADRQADERPPAELSIGDADGEAKERATPPRRIGVRNGSKITLVDVETIDWVEASGDYARIHSGKQRYLVSQRMHALERLLVAREFVRVHRSLIVNVKRIRELHREPDGGGTLVLADGVRLRVARGRWEAMERALEMEEF